VPARLKAARDAGDWKEQRAAATGARERLPRARQLALPARASTAARIDAGMAEQPVLEVRGLIAEARAYISMQEFNQGERLLGAAEHILETNPSPELSADIDLAYSSLSYMLDKPDLAADYAARGLHALGLRAALPIRVRLLRNQANALTKLGHTAEARQAIDKGIELLVDVRDPKLSAELYLEDARVAQAIGDNAAQVASGERVLAGGAGAAQQPAGRAGPRDAGHGARAARRPRHRRRELQLALASFRALGLDREERRVLRALAHEQLRDGKAPDPTSPAPAGAGGIARPERLRARRRGLRGAHEVRAAEVRRAAAAGRVALTAQRERTLTYQRRFATRVAGGQPAAAG
jgi:hypothetical protein